MTDKPEAGIGYLTADFFRRFENAANIAARLTAWLYLAGHIRTCLLYTSEAETVSSVC